MYPPAMNLVRHLARRGWTVSVHTTRGTAPFPEFSEHGVEVHRARPPRSRSALQRAVALLRFHLPTTWRLLARVPRAILYFEPQSSFPVYIATVGRRIPVFIHYHEYHEPAQFLEKGMRLARVFRRLEERLQKRARWISHTNPERLELFLADNPGAARDVSRVLPNMPPASWFMGSAGGWLNAPPPPLRLVYVGSLSRQDTYIEPVVNWLRAQPRGSVTLDVFAYNTDSDTRRYLQSIDEDFITFHPSGVHYDDLPEALARFHTGLILYRANTLNYRHNASNKLFEYLAVGLDVLFPSSMLGVASYARAHEAPRVLEVDFENWESIDLAVLSTRGALPSARPMPDSATALAELTAALERAVPEEPAMIS